MQFFRKEFLPEAIDSAFGLGDLEKEGARMMLEADYDGKLAKYGSFQGNPAELLKSELKTAMESGFLPENLLSTIAESAVKLFEAATI